MIDAILMVLVFGSVFAVLAYFAGGAVIEFFSSSEEGQDARASAKRDPITSILSWLMVFSFLGFVGGLLLAALGFEPTSEGGRKYWTISGAVAFATMLILMFRKNSPF